MKKHIHIVEVGKKILVAVAMMVVGYFASGCATGISRHDVDAGNGEVIKVRKIFWEFLPDGEADPKITPRTDRGRATVGYGVPYAHGYGYGYGQARFRSRRAPAPYHALCGEKHHPWEHCNAGRGFRDPVSGRVYTY